MATIRSFTSLEQSRKLAEILPIESADMCYIAHSEIINIHEPFYKKMDKEDIPCWSLAALLSVLPDYTLQTDIDGTVFVVCESKKPMISDAYDNPVDACVEMILKLKENNLI